MSHYLRCVSSVYRWMLTWYPTGFRAEFEEEMRGIWEIALDRSAENGWQGPLVLFGRELRDWPAAVWREHRRAWRHGKMEQEQSHSLLEILASLAIFLLPVLGTAATGIPSWLGGVMAVIFFGSAVGALILAVVKGIPRWALPYVGVMLSGVIFLGSFWGLWRLIYPSVEGILGPEPWPLGVHLLYDGLQAAFAWFLTLLAAILLVGYFALWMRTHGLAQRLWGDWTQLSFLIFGGVVFYIGLIFDAYQQENIWEIAAWCCMAAGAWVHLRARTQRSRILALVVSVTLAMWIVAVGKWYIVPLQVWPIWFEDYHPETERWFEAGRTIIQWVGIMTAMLAPALLTLLPQYKEPGLIPGQIPSEA